MSTGSDVLVAKASCVENPCCRLSVLWSNLSHHFTGTDFRSLHPKTSKKSAGLRAPHLVLLWHAHILVDPGQRDEFELRSGRRFQVRFDQRLQQEQVGEAQAQGAHADAVGIPHW